MSSNLNKLYSGIIKANNEKPFHFEQRTDAQDSIKAYNPICGDRFELHIDCEGQKIRHIYFHGFGCAISKASTSILTKSLEGKGLSDALAICKTFLKFMDKEPMDNALVLPDDFMAFSGVHEFPERYDCATLSWKEMKNFLESKQSK